MINNLVREEFPFKLNLQFGCDCKSHEDHLVLKCTHNNFFVKTEVDVKKNVLAASILLVVIVFQDFSRQIIWFTKLL